jgi:hypothetical protein
MGQMQSANAQAAAANYNARVQENNAQIARDNAADARKRGLVAMDDTMRKTSALKGRQIAVMSANNLDITSGSPLDILGDTAQLGQWDARTTENAYEREARGHETQSMNFSAEAELSRMNARASKSAGTIGAIGTLASGIGSVANSWYKMA